MKNKFVGDVTYLLPVARNSLKDVAFSERSQDEITPHTALKTQPRDVLRFYNLTKFLSGFKND